MSVLDSSPGALTDKAGTPTPWTVQANTFTEHTYTRKSAEKVVERLLDAAYRVENPLPLLQIAVTDSRSVEDLSPADLLWRSQVGGPTELIKVRADDLKVRS